MNTPNLDHIPNPLVDTFQLCELRLIAPWIWEDVQRFGEDRLLLTICQRGADPGQPQTMQSQPFAKSMSTCMPLAYLPSGTPILRVDAT